MFQLRPDKSTHHRGQIAVAVACTGILLMVGAQRKHEGDLISQSMRQDLDRLTRITPDGGRINGSWIAARYEDQELVDLAQYVHGAVLTGRPLPSIARHLLAQRCDDLEIGLRHRRVKDKFEQGMESDILLDSLRTLRSSLLEDRSGEELRDMPLSERERRDFADLLASTIHPLCVWEPGELRKMHMRSDRGMSARAF